MPANDQKTDQQLNRAVRAIRALIRLFGEAVILDAIAICLETPDGLRLLRCAADFSRAIDDPTVDNSN